MRQKDGTGAPTSTPYIDTTKADLGGISNTKSGSPGYSWRVPVTLIYSGAILDTNLMITGKNPYAIACHGDQDETTPYKSAIVNAQVTPDVLIPIVKVHGTYQITRLLDKRGVNTKFNLVDQDKFPQYNIADSKSGPLNMYKKGVYTFLNQSYMPWDSLQSGYEQSSKLFMDTLVRYTAPRLAYAFGLVKLSDVGTDTVTGVFNNYNSTKSFDIYPNPSNGKLFIDNHSNNSEFNLIIFNSIGQILVNNKITGGGNIILDLNNWPKGIYFINLKSDKETSTQKLILNK
jgi:hypothetical protein